MSANTSSPFAPGPAQREPIFSRISHLLPGYTYREFDTPVHPLVAATSYPSAIIIINGTEENVGRLCKDLAQFMGKTCRLIEMPAIQKIANAVEPWVHGKNRNPIEANLVDTVIKGLVNIKDRKPAVHRPATTPIIFQDHFHKGNQEDLARLGQLVTVASSRDVPLVYFRINVRGQSELLGFPQQFLYGKPVCLEMIDVTGTNVPQRTLLVLHAISDWIGREKLTVPFNISGRQGLFDQIRGVVSEQEFGYLARFLGLPRGMVVRAPGSGGKMGGPAPQPMPPTPSRDGLPYGPFGQFGGLGSSPFGVEFSSAERGSGGVGQSGTTGGSPANFHGSQEQVFSRSSGQFGGIGSSPFGARIPSADRALGGVRFPGTMGGQSGSGNPSRGASGGFTRPGEGMGMGDGMGGLTSARSRAGVSGASDRMDVDDVFGGDASIKGEEED